MQTDLYNLRGEKQGKISLPDAVFKAEINKPLMTQAIRVYLSNQRQASAKAKTRGEVGYSTRKIYRQKGTGRARHGDRNAPIFVHGGKAHGPTGGQNYQLKFNKNMRRLALFSALTNKVKDKELIVLSGLEKIEAKTKKMAVILGKFKKSQPKAGPPRAEKLSIILPKPLDNIIKAGRNIERLNLLQANSLNTYEILNGGKLLLMESSIDIIKKIYLKE